MIKMRQKKIETKNKIVRSHFKLSASFLPVGELTSTRVCFEFFGFTHLRAGNSLQHPGQLKRHGLNLSEGGINTFFRRDFGFPEIKLT